jgi:hypothetical protein
VVSIWLNHWNRCFCLSSRIPIPVSLTAIVTAATAVRSSRRAHTIAISPRFGVLHRVGQQIQDHLSHAILVGDHIGRVGVDHVAEAKSLARRGLAHRESNASSTAHSSENRLV